MEIYFINKKKRRTLINYKRIVYYTQYYIAYNILNYILNSNYKSDLSLRK